MNKVVHFEIPMDDAARAKAFYQTAFGWEMTDYPELNYTIAATTPLDDKRMPKEPGAINGGMAKRSETFTVPSFSILVDDVDAASEKVKAAGGTIVKEKMSVGDMGFMAYFKDTEGNLLSLWQPTKM